MRCPGEGRSPRRVSPSTTLPADAPAARRRGVERPQEGPVEAAHSRSHQIIAKGNLGLLDRGRKYDIEADDLGPTADHRIQNPADFRGPGRDRRSLERGRG